MSTIDTNEKELTYTQKHYRLNPDVYKNAAARYYKKNAEKLRAKSRDVYHNDPVARVKKLIKMKEYRDRKRIERMKNKPQPEPEAIAV